MTIFSHQHEAQLLNYLKATTYEVGLLLNFGPNPVPELAEGQVKRKAYDNTTTPANRSCPKDSNADCHDSLIRKIMPIMYPKGHYNKSALPSLLSLPPITTKSP